MLQLRCISGYPRREAGDFCWGEFGGKPGIFVGEKSAESRGFVSGLYFWLCGISGLAGVCFELWSVSCFA